MLWNLIDKPSSQRRRWISLVVRETNLAAQLFFRAHGFRAVSILRHYYDETPEDAYLIRYRCRSEREGWARPCQTRRSSSDSLDGSPAIYSAGPPPTQCGSYAR